MIWEAFGSVALGFALAWVAFHRLPDRLPSRRLVLGAGPLGALFGAYVTHSALGPGHVVATLIGAAAMGAVLLSLLVRPTGRIRRSAAA